MKLKEYIKSLNRLVEEDPKLLELDIIYAIDDEGNNYKEVNYEPSKGYFEDGEFDTEYVEGINAICIN